MSGLEIAIIVVSILLIAVILLQQRAAGLGGAFGSDTTVFTTRRGAEKTLYRLTILLGIIFIVLALWRVYIEKPKLSGPPDTNSAQTTDTNTP